MGEIDDPARVNGDRQRGAARARPDISVVVPVYNEVDNVKPLHEGLVCALSGLQRRFEILIVDDGSTDGTRAALRELAAESPHLRVLLFRRNFGQTAAMAAGFDHAHGSIVITMDGDLQNDPADIPRLLEELERGYDIVCGWRRHRKDGWATRLLPSKVANFLISRTTGVPIHDTGCSLRAYRSWVVRSLELYSDMHRFIAALAAGIGARVSEIPVRHHPRRHGRSKYGLGRIFRVIIDLVAIKMLIQFSAHPIRWFSMLALPLFVVSPLLFVLSFTKIQQGVFAGTAFDSFYATAAVVALLVAFNVVLLGCLAELQLKVSRSFQRRIPITAREAAQ